LQEFEAISNRAACGPAASPPPYARPIGPAREI